MKAKIPGLGQPLFPASEKPYRSEPNPIVEVATEIMSIFSSLVGSTSLTKKNASTKTMPAIGAIMLKR